MKMIEKVKRIIEEYGMLENGAQVIIGLSGGPDSVCLFDIFDRLKDEMDLKLYPVHINHGLRGDEADKDQEYCRELARERGLELRIFSFNCSQVASERGLTTEEAGRALRYESFRKVAREVRGDGETAIAVAQNRDDQAETVLFRIMRGTGIDGLAGIPHCRRDEDGNAVIRPLLDFSRDEIMDYLKERGIEPRFDKTNDEPLYTRNRIRLQLIPQLQKEFNPRINDALVRLAEAAVEDGKYLSSMGEAAYGELVKEEGDGRILLDGDGLRGLPRPLSGRVLAQALSKLGLKSDMNRGAYEEAHKLLISDNPSARVDLPGGYYMARVYRDLVVGNNSFDNDNQLSSLGEGSYSLVVHPATKNEEEESGKGPEVIYGAVFRREDAGDGLVLRTRRPGDVIRLSGGTKKIQDLFVDRKIPKEERDRILLVARGSEILLIYGENVNLKMASAKALQKEDGEKWEEDSVFVEITVSV